MWSEFRDLSERLSAVETLNKENAEKLKKEEHVAALQKEIERLDEFIEKMHEHYAEAMKRAELKHIATVETLESRVQTLETLYYKLR
jgi:Na+/phosphate symporter